MTTIVLYSLPIPSPVGEGVSTPPGRARGEAVWLLLILSFGAAGAFSGAPGTPPLPIAIGAGAPLVVFFVWLPSSQSFREFVLSLDLPAHCGNAGLGWAGLRLSASMRTRCCGCVRPASWAWGHGHWGHGPVDHPRPDPSTCLRR